jgi:hypothetical protein
VIVKHLPPIVQKQILRRNRIKRTDNFVRDSFKVHRMIAETLAKIRLERAHRETSEPNLVSWEKDVKRLCRELRGDGPACTRVLDVLTWYKDHWNDDEYIPRVESGKSLLDKFDRLEAAMHKRVSFRDENDEELSIEQVLRQKGFVSDRLIDTMLRDIIKPAKKLRFIDVKGDALLTSKLIDLYNAMREERNNSNLSSDMKIRLGGPLEILKRYIDWLIEKDWEASTRVLKVDSPAFAQFRRDFRSLEGWDPISGKGRPE